LPQYVCLLAKHLYLGRKNSHLVILDTKNGTQRFELRLLQFQLIVESLKTVPMCRLVLPALVVLVRAVRCACNSKQANYRHKAREDWIHVVLLTYDRLIRRQQ
jgi:hypothetical protein